MVRKKRELKRDLRNAGWEVVKERGKQRGKGSHTMWRHPLVPDVTVILSGHDGDDADGNEERHVARMIAEVERRLQ